MSWQGQKGEVQKSIRETIQNIVAIKGEDLARTEELGKTLSYESGVTLFNSIIDFFNRFSNIDTSFLSIQMLQKVNEACAQIYNCFEKIRTVDLANQSSPASVRDNMIQELDNAFSSRISFLAPILAASQHESLSIRKKEQNVERIIGEMKTLKAQVEKDVSQIRNTMNATLSDVQKMAASAGVSAHATHFDQEAKRYEESSLKWLGRTVWLAAGAFFLTLVIAAHSIFFDFSVGQSIQMAIAKITVLAVIYSCMIWSGKVYRSERHNWTVNRHRCNALLTFETFASAASDEVTKNAVLLQATESIFGHQPSGFSEKSQESGTPKVLEVFRNLTSGSSSSD